MTEPTLPVPNIPLLRKAVEWAEAEAAKTDGTGLWNQALYADPRECGTSYCIAGFAVVTALPDVQVTEFGDLLTADGRFGSWRQSGQQALGITFDEGVSLFHEDNSITDVRRIAEDIAARAGERL